MHGVYSGVKADEVNGVLAQLTDAFARNIGAKLKGLYLHGSMAMGCFRPWSSDIDLLAVVHGPMERAGKLALVGDVMAIAEGGEEFRKVEFSVVTAEEALRAAHPIRYILHYSDGWHQAYKKGRAELVIEGGEDGDLAAHFMVTGKRGVALYGAPVGEAIGKVSRADYLKAVWYDIAGSEQAAADNPAYTVLNLCRTLLYLETGHVGSKLEGGRWAEGQRTLAEYAGIIAGAIVEYTAGLPGRYDGGQVAPFVRHMLGLIGPPFE